MEPYSTTPRASMVSEETMYESKSVCVIGAGPSGIASARELRREGHTVVVMEQSSDIGGQWLYNPCVEGEDPLGMDAVQNVHSSVYDSLRLATPREAMGFSDFPFVTKIGRDTRRFPGHKELFLYLSDFCDWFGLRELIRFNTKVDYVGMVNFNEDCKDLKWVVKSFNKSSEMVREEIFDAVVVATGHYSKPRLPNIKGMDKWKRRHIHSHLYRKPEPYKGEVVVVIGNCQSGHDISMELAHVAKEVHLSVKLLPISEALTKVVSKNLNLHIHLEVDCLHEDGKVVFKDGSWVIANSIIYCTGYSYSLPFLDTKGTVKIDNDRVGPLYEHTFPPLLAPSLSLWAFQERFCFLSLRCKEDGLLKFFLTKYHSHHEII